MLDLRDVREAIIYITGRNLCHLPPTFLKSNFY